MTAVRPQAAVAAELAAVRGCLLGAGFKLATSTHDVRSFLRDRAAGRLDRPGAGLLRDVVVNGYTRRYHEEAYLVFVARQRGVRLTPKSIVARPRRDAFVAYRDRPTARQREALLSCRPRSSAK